MARPIKHGLGRGLGALLGSDIEETPQETVESAAPAAENKAEPQDSVILISIDKIDPNRDQPRKAFDEESLQELAQSLRSVGIVQPLIVKKTGKRYQLIAGERRWRAARIAEISEVPCVVRDWNEETQLEVSLVENLQRDDLNPIDEALGIKSLMEQCSYTQEKVSERLGKSRSAVANTLRLLTLPESIIEMLRTGKLTAGHARALITLKSAELQQRLANLAAAQSWSVRQMERICAEQLQEKPEKTREKPKKTQEMTTLEHMARNIFGTKAELDGDTEKGKLILHYYNPDDLQHIWEILEMMEQGAQ